MAGDRRDNIVQFNGASGIRLADGVASGNLPVAKNLVAIGTTCRNDGNLSGP